MKPKTITFLFGSGISLDAGLPSTGKITDCILSGKGVTYNALSKSFNWDKTKDVPTDHVIMVRDFLNRIKVEIDLYYHTDPSRITNYEDIDNVVRRMFESVSGNYDDASVGPLIEKIFGHEWDILSRRKDEIRELLEDAENYIKDVVCDLLCEETKQIDYLNVLKDFCLKAIQQEDKPINIFTLNNDVILEKLFLQGNNSIRFTDGFDNAKGDYRFWNKELFWKKNIFARLFKLHGSIDWYRVSKLKRLGNDSIAVLPSKIISSPSRFRTTKIKIKNSEYQIGNNLRPLLLVGTFQKIMDYLNTDEIFIDLFFCFYKSLALSDKLIISGYGFGDKAINSRIVQWIDSSKKAGDRRILLIDPGYERLYHTSRGAIRNRLHEWEQNDIITIPRGKNNNALRLGDVNLQIILDFISS